VDVKLSRRTFLMGSGALALAFAGLAIFRWRRDGEVIRRVLEKHLPGIRIPDREVQLYRKDLEEFASERMRTTLTLISPFEFAYPLLALPILRRARDKFEHRVVVDFLLSTDFFREPSVRDGSRDVRYTGFHEKHLACSNPFAVLR